MSQNFNQEFEEAYKSLNEKQQEAVDTIEGPVMVIAGPGTGKTQILTLRIANILRQTDTSPENILALTFTESGAAAMRDRLRRYIGAEAYRVPIFTFHGFASRLIPAYPDAYEKIVGGRLATDLEKISIIENIIEGKEVKLLRPHGRPDYYVTPIVKEISKLKREYVTPDKLANIIEKQKAELDGMEKYHEKGAHKGKVKGDYKNQEKSINKNQELLLVYRQYQAVLKDRHLYDYEDMIVETVKALEENEDMRLDLQETYQYVLADEHQDVNGSQNQILRQLTAYHERPNIFVVGDEKQAIYRFQGASLENFLFFEDLFGKTKSINLKNNYRSKQEILDTAHSLIAVAEGPLKELRKPLDSKTGKEAKIEFREFHHQLLEDTFLVDSIKANLAEGTAAGEIAVIVRTNREVEQISSKLREAGIPANSSADSDILDHPITASVLNLIEACVSDDLERPLFSLLHEPYLGIEAGDLVKILKSRSSREPLSKIIRSKRNLKDIGVENPEPVIKFSSVLDEAIKLSGYKEPHRVVSYLVESSGLKDYLMEEEPLEGGRVLRRLYDEIEQMVVDKTATSLRDITYIFSQLKQYGLSLNAPFIALNEDAVEVMTAHKAKGLEFKTVYLPHLTDRSWGGSSKRELFKIPVFASATETDALDDEKRLLYVALTRAKENLYLSYSLTNPEGAELLISRLLQDVDNSAMDRIDTSEFGKDLDLLETVNADKVPDLDNLLFLNLLKERGLSATSLNNYLKSPYDYIYKNALRVPEVQPEHMLFGTAMHNTMEYITRHYTREGEIPKTGDISKLLKNELLKQPMSDTVVSKRHEQGLNNILLYLDARSSSFSKTSYEEFSIKVGFETNIPECPEIPLTGKLDRLDFNETGEVIRVVDYKTGKPSSRNEIEGNTKNSKGDYKRQLVFYALLLSLYSESEKDGRFSGDIEYVLSFLEPGNNDQIKEESFYITSEEIDELKEVIRGVVKDFVSGEIFKAPLKDSEYPELAAKLTKQI